MLRRSLLVTVLGAVGIATGVLFACTTFETDAGGDAGDGGSGADTSTTTPDGDRPVVGADGGDASYRIPVIDTGPFAISTTEVTQAQYQAFLASKNGKTDGQSSECTWNDSFAPATASGCPVYAYDPLGTPDLPVTCVDWCDAKAYCEWAGLGLCGSLDGGAVPFNTQDKGQWYAACSMAGSRPYPYGPKFDRSACNVHDAGPRKVGSTTNCEGGYPGLFDMSGNVAEWENSCTPGGAPDSGVVHDVCLYRGGSYWSDAGPCAETGATIRERGDRYATIGIRCCSH